MANTTDSHSPAYSKRTQGQVKPKGGHCTDTFCSNPSTTGVCLLRDLGQVCC